jgi:hypothetical protein
MTNTVTPPAPLPQDAQAVADAALAVLRLDPADIDADRIEQAAVVAIDLASQQLDYDAADVPTTLAVAVTDAVVTLTVELYRRKDAPLGVTDSWSVDGAVLRLSSDVFRGVRSQLAKYRARRGVA